MIVIAYAFSLCFIIVAYVFLFYDENRVKNDIFLYLYNPLRFQCTIFILDDIKASLSSHVFFSYYMLTFSLKHKKVQNPISNCKS